MPNVVPEYAKVWLWLRDWKRGEVESAARAHAQARRRRGDHDRDHVDRDGAGRLLGSAGQRNGRAAAAREPAAGSVRRSYTEEEQAFAKQIQKRDGRAGNRHGRRASSRSKGRCREGGSTDVGDVSWIAPTLHVTVATAPLGAPWHAWPVVATGGMSIGHKGMMPRRRRCSPRRWSISTSSPHALAAVQAEFKAKKGTRRLQVVRARTVRRRCRRTEAGVL